MELFKEASREDTLIVPGSFVWQEKDRMYNSCFFIYGGEVVFRYDKSRDGGANDLAKSYGLKPKYGTELGVFEWNGFRVGVEICADGGILSEKGIRNLDLIFLISSGNASLHFSSDAIRMGGYSIVAEGAHGIYKTEKKQSGGKLFIPRIKEFQKFYENPEIRDYIFKAYKELNLSLKKEF